MKEKKARVEDAMHATRAAVEEGIVPGGGVALVRALSALDNLKLPEEEQTGVQIIRRAAQEPCKRIAMNAGTDGAVVLDKVKNGKGPFGFNAATEQFEDLFKAGIIDPTKVVRTALQNAASVAGLLLTTEAMVARSPRTRRPRRARRRRTTTCETGRQRLEHHGRPATAAFFAAAMRCVIAAWLQSSSRRDLPYLSAYKTIVG